jgi:hypothetical protein
MQKGVPGSGERRKNRPGATFWHFFRPPENFTTQKILKTAADGLSARNTAVLPNLRPFWYFFRPPENFTTHSERLNQRIEIIDFIALARDLLG